MDDRARLLEQACAALCDGDPLRCEALVTQFAREMRARPLTDGERPGCVRQLERLRGLAEAAQAGADSARQMIRDIVARAGGLDIYGPGGRQRVEIRLDPRPRRF